MTLTGEGFHHAGTAYQSIAQTPRPSRFSLVELQLRTGTRMGCFMQCMHPDYLDTSSSFHWPLYG